MMQMVEDVKDILLTRRQVTDSGCWEWTGYRHAHGYGYLRVNGRSRPVHRISGVVFNGWDLEDPLRTCHKCDNPPCFNPEHLFQGTDADNVRDMTTKGRHGTAGTHRTHCPNGHEKEWSGSRWWCAECGRTSARNYKRSKGKAS